MLLNCDCVYVIKLNKFNNQRKIVQKMVGLYLALEFSLKTYILMWKNVINFIYEKVTEQNGVYIC